MRHAALHRLHARRRLRHPRVADAAYAFPLAEDLDPVAAAPLLCAGLIGWRSLEGAGDGQDDRPLRLRRGRPHHRPGLPLAGTARLRLHQPGDAAGQAFARSLGADWAGGSDEKPPEPLDAAILFAPVGALVPAALAAVRKGGRVVCGGIHMSDIPAFPYRLLWEERSVVSVANLTRADGEEFLALAPRVPVQNDDDALPAREGQRGARRPARGPARGRGGARPLKGRPAAQSPPSGAVRTARSAPFSTRSARVQRRSACVQRPKTPPYPPVFWAFSRAYNRVRKKLQLPAFVMPANRGHPMAASVAIGDRARAKALDPRFRGDDRRDASSVQNAACTGPAPRRSPFVAFPVMHRRYTNF